LQQFELNAEERQPLVCASVQPVQRLFVFITEMGTDPNHDFCVQPRGVRHQLPQMTVIRWPELVLDDHFSIGTYFLAKNVHREIPDRHFRLCAFDLKA